METIQPASLIRMLDLSASQSAKGSNKHVAGQGVSFPKWKCPLHPGHGDMEKH